MLEDFEGHTDDLSISEVQGIWTVGKEQVEKVKHEFHSVSPMRLSKPRSMRDGQWVCITIALNDVLQPQCCKQDLFDYYLHAYLYWLPPSLRMQLIFP